MADASVVGVKRSSLAKSSRVHWTESETRALIQVWEDNLQDLRRQKRNAGVYDTMVLHLGRLEIHRTRKQVIAKIDNLTHMYRQVFLPFSLFFQAGGEISGQVG